jgi:hypothetical protein
MNAQSNGHILPGMNEREQVEQTADRLRDQLLLTLRELERRREQVRAWGPQLRRLMVEHREALLVAGAGSLVLAGVGVALSRLRSRSRQRHIWERRRKALAFFWSKPEQVMQAEAPFLVQVGQRFILSFASAAVSVLARRLVESINTTPQERPALPKASA